MEAFRRTQTQSAYPFGCQRLAARAAANGELVAAAFQPKHDPPPRPQVELYRCTIALCAPLIASYVRLINWPRRRQNRDGRFRRDQAVVDQTTTKSSRSEADGKSTSIWSSKRDQQIEHPLLGGDVDRSDEGLLAMT